jgi:hypothetical protein
LATKLYLHNVHVGSAQLPSTEQSTLTSANDFEASQDRNRLMDTVIGTSQTSVANTSNASTSAVDYYALRFVSRKLNQTSVAANTWTLNFAASQSNTLANFPVSGNNQPIYINAYVWRPSSATKVGTILDGNSASVYDEPTDTAERVMHGTFSGSSVASVQAGDVIVLEMWFRVTQGMTTAYTQTIFFDGTTENTTENATVSNHASYLETPENLAFVAEVEEPRSLISSANSAQATTAGATEYWPLANTSLVKSSTETDRQIPYRTSGVLSKLYVRITGNSTTAASTIRTRKNAANGGLAIRVPSGYTGVLEEDLLTDAVTAGEKWNLQTVSGGTGTLSFTIMSVHFKSNTAGEVVSKLSTSSHGITTNGTRYTNIDGLSTVGATELDHSSKLRKACTIKNLWVNVTANARTTNTTFTIRVAGADTTITVTYGNVETGFKEDTTHTASVSAGDNISIKHVAGTGAETLTYSAGFELVTTDGSCYVCCTASSSASINANQTNFMAFGGQNRNTTESQVRQKARLAYSISELTTNVTANTVTANSTMVVRVNGVDSALSITYGNAETGIKNDSDVVDILETDEINFEIVTGATGTALDLRQIGMWLTITTLTPVSKESIQIYSMRKEVPKESIQKYNIRKEIPKESTQIFAIRSIRSKESIQIHAIRKFATGLSTQIYNVRSFISKESIQRWNERATIFKESIQRFAIRNSRSQESTQIFAIRKIASAISTQLHNIRSFISKESTQRFDIRKIINKESIQTYAIRKGISKEIIQLYKILSPVFKESIQIFSIRSFISKESIQRWNERQIVFKETIQRFNIRKIAAAISTQIYTLEGLATVFREITQIYAIREQITKESIQKWNLMSFISKESIQRYQILVSISKESIQRFSILQLISRESTQRFNIRKIASAVSTQIYHLLFSIFKESIQRFSIRKGISKESIQIYTIRKIAAAISTQIHNIRQIISKESIQIWTIEGLGQVSREITQIYSIRAIRSKESIQRWKILQTLFKESIQRFAIRNSRSKESIQLYTVRRFVVKESTQIYRILKSVSKESIQIYTIAQQLTQVFREITQIYSIRAIASRQSTQRWHIFNIVFREILQKWTIAEREVFKPRYTKHTKKHFLRFSNPFPTYIFRDRGR